MAEEKPGRANWPEVGETRTGHVGTAEHQLVLEDLGKQIQAINRIRELTGIDPHDPFVNNRLYAIARERLGMTREEFDGCDDWDFLALLELRTEQPAQAPEVHDGRPIGDAVGGDRLKGLRGGISQEALAAACGVSTDTIQRGERGKRWSEDTFKRVADGLTKLLQRRIVPDDLKPQ